MIGTDNTLHSIHVICSDCMPEVAAELGVERVRQKYGQHVDLRRWSFSVQPVFAGLEAQALRFYVSPDGRPAPLEL